MADVFVSYKHEDKQRIRRIVSGLENLGLTVWYDPELRGGDQYEDVIKRELAAAKAVLVCWSRAATESDWVKSEARRALNRRVLVPCLLENCEQPMGLDNTQAEDLSDWDGSGDHTGWRQTIEAISRLVNRPGLRRLLEASSSGDNRRLLDWARAFPEDAKARETFAEVARKEREQFQTEMRNVQTALADSASLWEKNAREKLRKCADEFEAWVARIEEKPYDDRPTVAGALDGMLGSLGAKVVKDIEVERDKAREKVAELETTLSRSAAELSTLTRVAATRGRVSLLVGGLLGALSGAAGYHAVRTNADNSAATIADLQRQAQAMDADVRSVGFSRDNFKDGVINLQASARETKLAYEQLEAHHKVALQDIETCEATRSKTKGQCELGLASARSDLQTLDDQLRAFGVTRANLKQDLVALQTKAAHAAEQNKLCPSPPPAVVAAPACPTKSASLAPAPARRAISLASWLTNANITLDASSKIETHMCSLTVHGKAYFSQTPCSRVALPERSFAVFTGDAAAPTRKAWWHLEGNRKVHLYWDGSAGSSYEDLGIVVWKQDCGRNDDGSVEICLSTAQ